VIYSNYALVLDRSTLPPMSVPLILAGVACGMVVVSYALSVVPRVWVVRISNATIVTQVGLVLTAWLLMATMPRTRNWSGSVGETCPDLDNVQGVVLGVVAFGSLAIGVVAALSAIACVARRAAAPGRLLAGLATCGLCVAIWLPLIVQALCGFN
jgi:hypothetical protein